MTVNEKIKAYIESKGINLTHLAKKIEMSKQNLSSVLSNNDIKLSQLQKICNVLGLPITYFFDERLEASRHDSNNRANENEPRYLSKGRADLDPDAGHEPEDRTTGGMPRGSKAPQKQPRPVQRQPPAGSGKGVIRIRCWLFVVRTSLSYRQLQTTNANSQIRDHAFILV
jgi:transcriptional regulator with XRE-family HTH domain